MRLSVLSWSSRQRRPSLGLPSSGLPVLGIVSNMAGYQARLDAPELRFVDGASGEDATERVRRILAEKAPELLSMRVAADVFPAAGGGPEAMAAAFGVPYLGSLPLDPALLRACEAGESYLAANPDGAAAAALRGIVAQVVRATSDDDGDGDGEA